MEPQTNTRHMEKLSQFFPLNSLSQAELRILANCSPLVYANENTLLVKQGVADGKCLFLLEGSLELLAEDGHRLIIENGSPQALKPISHLSPHLYTITSKTPVEYVMVENRIIDNLMRQTSSYGEWGENLEFPPQLLSNVLFQNLYSDLIEDRLVIPSLPNVATRIRKLVDHEVDLRQVAALILTDPATAAMVVKTANCALFRIGEPVKTIQQAVLRMGIKMVKNLVISFCLRDLFKSRIAFVNKKMLELWVHSSEVAAVSLVLATKLGKPDPEQALLMGLLHDIGSLAILGYLEKYPKRVETPEKVNEVIQHLHGEIGAAILSKWEFTEEYITVAREVDDWTRDPAEQADDCDLILIAQLHTFIGKPQAKLDMLMGKRTFPVLTELPAFRKLGLQSKGPEQSLSILSSATEQLNETRQILCA